MIQSSVEIKSWSERTPPVEQVRPCTCIRCCAASRPPGRPLQIIGHGLRARQVLGPSQLGQQPVALALQVRRFLCLVCGAVMTVVPRGVVSTRLYCAVAIMLGLALWAIRKLSTAAVREQVSPWQAVAEPRQWAMPARWVRAVRQARLFAEQVRPAPARWSHRQVAERVVTSLWARAAPGAEGLEAMVVVPS